MPLSGSQRTQLRPDGTPERRYGSFSGKTTQGAGKSYTETFTRLGIAGVSARPYGSFAGKSSGTPFSLSVSQAIAVTGSLSPSATLQFDNDWSFEPPLELPQVAGLLSVSGDIQVTAVFLNLSASTVSVTGTLTPTGNVQWVQNLTASTLGILSGSMSMSGDVEIAAGTPIDIAAAGPISLSAAASLTGNVQIGSAFDLSAFPVPIIGTTVVFGTLDSIEIGQPFELGAASATIFGSLTITGSIDAGTRYTHDSRHRLGHHHQSHKKGRIGKASSGIKRGRVGPRRL